MAFVGGVMGTVGSYEGSERRCREDVLSGCVEWMRFTVCERTW